MASSGDNFFSESLIEKSHEYDKNKIDDKAAAKVPPAPAATPAVGVSCYNEANICTIQSARIHTAGLRIGLLELEFSVHCDGSLGPLQDATSSTITWTDKHGRQELSTQPRIYYEQQASQFVSGTLIYTDVSCDCLLNFAFGSSGYSSVEFTPTPFESGALMASGAPGVPGQKNKKLSELTLKEFFGGLWKCFVCTCDVICWCCKQMDDAAK